MKLESKNVPQFSGMSVLRAYVVKIFDNIFDDGKAGGSDGGPANATAGSDFLLFLNNKT
jgi:hypothetical protein